MFSGKFIFALSIFILFALASSKAQSAGYIRNIIVFGNHKTEKKAIVNIMDVEKNEFVTTVKLKKIKQNLINCGLFRKVRVRARRAGKNRMDIIVNLIEKASLFVFPIFRAWSGRYSGGVIFGESNLFGENKKTLLVLEGGNKLNQLYAVYEDTSLFDSDFTLRLEVIARADRTPLYNGYDKVDEVHIKDTGVMLTPGYKWTDEIATKFAFDFRYNWYDETPVMPITNVSGFNFAFRFEFIYDSLKRNEAILTGSSLSLKFEIADARLGSSFTYNKGEVDFTYALKFLRYFNWKVNFQNKLGKDLPFNKQFTLGGTSLRGYADRQFRGDTLVKLTNELTFPIFTHKLFGLRGLAFYDMGFVYFDSLGISREDFANGTGGGLRVYMKRIIMPLLGLDFGYGLDNKKFGVYFSIGLIK